MEEITMRKIWGVMTCFFSLKISRGVHISKALTAGSVHSIEVEIEARGLAVWTIIILGWAGMFTLLLVDGFR